MESNKRLSRHEQAVMVQLLRAHGLRVDGRAAGAERHVTLETEVIPSAAGSARVRLPGSTEVLAGTSTELQSHVSEGARPTSPEGCLTFRVEFCGAADRLYQGRGAEAPSAELTSLLESIYRPARRLRRSLMAGQQTEGVRGPLRTRYCCWSLCVDVLVLGTGGGNVVDAATVAVRAALATTYLPAVEWKEGVGRGGTAGWELIDDWERYQPVDVTSAPLSITLVWMTEGTGTADGVTGESALLDPVVDPHAEEESSAAAALTVASAGSRHLCGVLQRGVLSLPPETVKKAVEHGITRCAERCAALDAFIAESIAAAEADE